MGFLIGLLYVLLVVVSFFLCFVILIQDSKSGGLSTAFGGSGDTVLGASAQKQISKFTVYVSVVFFVLCISVGILSKRMLGTSRVEEESPPAAVGFEGEPSSAPAGLTIDPVSPGTATPGTNPPSSNPPEGSGDSGVKPPSPNTGDDKPDDSSDGNGG